MTNLFEDIHEYLKDFFKDTGTKIAIKPVSDHIIVVLFRCKIDDEFDYYLFGDDDFIASTCIYYDEMDPKMIPPYIGNRVIKMWNDCFQDLSFLDDLSSEENEE